MNRALLEKPFEPEQIRRRQGRNGMLDYVEGHSVIQRLNDALESAWSFEITHHELKDDEVIVLGRLTAGTPFAPTLTASGRVYCWSAWPTIV
jgi:hypothetical protein